MGEGDSRIGGLSGKSPAIVTITRTVCASMSPGNQREWTGALAGVAQWIEHGSVNQRSPVRFPVRAHAWVAGHVPIRGRVRGNPTLMFLSLSFSFPSPLSKNKERKSLKKKRKWTGIRMREQRGLHCTSQWGQHVYCVAVTFKMTE